MQAIGLLIMVLSVYGVVHAFLKRRNKIQQQALKDARKASGEEAIPEADISLADLSSSDWRKRAAAALQLSKNPNSESLPALANCLDDSDSDVRDAAVDALSYYGTDATSFILPHLESHQADTRTAAARTLGLIKDQSALAALHTALSDVSSWVRTAAANALGEIGSATSIPDLGKALSDSETSVREAAAAALNKIDTKAARDALKQYQERANHVSRRSR